MNIKSAGENLLLDARIAERAFEGVAVNFVVVGKNDCSAVGMLHFDMTALAMNFCEAQPLQSF
ncbi:MAG TPA: hypothetical protein VEX70_09185 [Pyrinomonadaceae bacterium]|nr:hypothetical protein [Pyrinomonadaceae bacterium]